MSTQNNNTVTFTEFIERHNIQIPVIQRDYVQGRALTDNEKEKRDDFVKKLMDALLPDGTPCHLDFVYGGRENFGSAEKVPEDAPFLPLDGQQRLTTLFLLHWTLLQKTAPMADDENELARETFRVRMAELSRFTYKTRISSGRFCRKLTELHIEPDLPLTAQIKEKYWYDHDMQSDPTVKAIMQMLSLMERMLDSEPYLSQKIEMLANLYDVSKRCITFDVLDMDQYNLTDGLYVKMNARGKELTAFENWKASFIDLIGNNDIEERDRFSYSMEHEWNDVFWKIAYQDYLDKVKEAKGEQVPYPKIDEAFMNFFNNMTRLFFFIIPEHQSLKAEDYKSGLWSTVIRVYEKSRTSREMLFRMLDTLHEIDTENGNISSFFAGIFTTEEEMGEKVRLFDGSTDLFEAVCSSSDTFSHILLFAILLYCMEHKVYKPEERLQVYARICRNYLYEHNYFNTSDVTISAQVRASDMAQYFSFFEALVSDTDPLTALGKLELKDDYALREKSKLEYYQEPTVRDLAWRLEDMPYTYGNLSAFASVLELCMSDPVLYCPMVWNAVEAFCNAQALTKVQLFVSFGYKGIAVRNCAYGKAIFLGGEFKGTKRWMVHFRKKYDATSPLDEWVLRYVKAFMQENDLNILITKHMPSDKHYVSYYMLKYPDVLASQVFWRDNCNFAPFYFAMMKPWENMDMITIHSFSNRPLNMAYQVCPMANAVVHRISRYKKYNVAKRMGCTGQFAYKEGIVINEHPNDWDKLVFSMKFGSNEWILPKETFDRLPVSLQRELERIDENNCILRQAEDKDLIEVAVDFIDKAIDEFERGGILQ